MLKKLLVSNYTLIDSLEITWDKGLTIITGETGAGKSILLGALGLVVGQRADSNTLKNKEIKCIVEAEFDLSRFDLVPFFETKDWDYSKNSIIRREIAPTGKSRAFVNDTPVGVSDLKELGEKLIDIHSQHETLLLTENLFQLKTLDVFAKNNTLLIQYKQYYAQYKELVEELEQLKQRNQKALLDIDYLSFQFTELDEANLKENETEELEVEQKILTHAEEIKQALASVLHILQDSENNVISVLAQSKNIFSTIENKLSETAALSERLKSVIVELQDIAYETEKLSEKVQFNPQRLEEINERISLLFGLLQKHRFNTVEELIQLKEKLQNDILGISSLENEIFEKETALNKCITDLNSIANALSKSRMQAINELENAISKILLQIGLVNATFTIHMEASTVFLPNGLDKITFFFSANKGVDTAPLQKVASGGELSRVMLAIKSVIAQSSLLPTIIFDEIDTGISGETADKTGNILKEMAKNIQVIAITHQAQIAAKGNTHLFVYKETTESSTRSLIRKLNNQERVEEIAKMLSGEKVSKAAIENAKQLLKN
ncbi:DNA repair protein RecN [Flavobacteriales bacterium]|nr:DNA repair protein RecN [Flavobacteriales bacterium]MCL4817077.1 DNA repair protein RecN [Flavobacteriales bacterium]WKZ76059.1 MAG: DNA repair protein RecN [Vicingaceae bacterium]GIK70496.1 MAG: DNA repair protein RecN [Bacteroidota bacterium]CAG0987349.1 DNA repair protein RecN [Flavobacteriales bacterium]